MSYPARAEGLVNSIYIYIYIYILYIYIYIYIYIFTNQISTSIHGTRKKQKNPGQEQEKKNISNHGPEEKEKSFLGKKERKDQPRPTPWKKSRGT